MRLLNLALAPLALAVVTWPSHAQGTPEPTVIAPRARVFWNREFGPMGDSSRAMIGVSTASGSIRDTLGLLIESITPGGPADKAGLVEGDRIVSINGTRLTLTKDDAQDEDMQGMTTRRLIRELEKVKAGDVVTLDVWSAGAHKTVKVTTASAGSLMPMRQVSEDDMDNRAVVGIDLQPTGSVRDTLGPMITHIEANGPADKAGLVEGDRILSIDNSDLRVSREDAGDQQVAEAKSNRFTHVLAGKKPGDVVSLRVYSGGQLKNVSVKTAASKDVYPDQHRGFRFRVGDMGPMGGVMVVPPVPPIPPMGIGMRFNLSEARAMREAQRAELEAARAGLEAAASIDVEGLTNDAAKMADSSITNDEAYRQQIRDLQRQLRDARAHAGYETHAASYDQTPEASASYAAVDDHGVIQLPGIRLSPVNDDLASYLGAGSRDGLFVAEADSRWGGLRQGDVVLRVNGEPVARGDMSWFNVNLDRRNSLDILRGGKPLTVEVGK